MSPDVALPTPEPRCLSPPDAIASLFSFFLQNLFIDSGNDTNDQKSGTDLTATDRQRAPPEPARDFTDSALCYENGQEFTY